MTVNVDFSRIRRYQRHVMEWRQHNASIERSQVHVSSELSVHIGIGFGPIARRSWPEPVLGATTEASDVPR